MKRQDVIDLLSGLRYRPGWEFSAFENSRGMIVLDVVCETVDTSRHAEGEYPENIDLKFSFEIDASNVFGPTGLLREVFEWLMAVELHESREFFRQANEGWRAPFHPHTFSGGVAWNLSTTLHNPAHPALREVW